MALTTSEIEKMMAVLGEQANSAGSEELRQIQAEYKELQLLWQMALRGEQQTLANRVRSQADTVRSIVSRLSDYRYILGLDWLAEQVGIARGPVDAAAPERDFRESLPESDLLDEGPDKPSPAPGPVAPDVVPSVSPGWSQDYQKLWNTMTMRPEWTERATAKVQQIVANQNRYASAVVGTAVPWWFVAVIHAMEADLNFKRHLHNGDPLTGRTVQVPKGRPPFGEPPFTWEASARDALSYERLDRITDWSLPNVLFNWHRFNGINNEYKRRGIPTPYLWSGSQHYRKGKYVADHVFDPEQPSKQVGAAVLLRTLIDLGAVTLGQGQALEGNPVAASGAAAALGIDFSGTDFKHIAAELDYPGLLASGAGGAKAEKDAVLRIQEWLNLQGFVTAIDGSFGTSTETQLKALQTKAGRPATGTLDPETWALLTAPLRRALAPIDHGLSPVLEDALLRVARQHIGESPTEIGGSNRGPWVRLYMRGKQGTDQKWCAGFVCLAMAQAARDLGIKPPFPRQVGVDALVKDAQAAGRLLAEAEVNTPLKRQSKLRPGLLFVVRDSAKDWTHTGIVLAVNESTFDTLEGNTGGDGGTDGPNARQGNRNYSKKDFLRLL